MFARLRHVFEDRRTYSATPCGAGRGSTACLRALTERQTTTAAGRLVFDTSSRRWPDFERGARRPRLRAAWTSTWTSSRLEGAPLPRHERNPNAPAAWRSTVKDQDTIICLGDVAHPDFWNEPRQSGDLKACPGTTSRAQSPQS